MEHRILDPQHNNEPNESEIDRLRREHGELKARLHDLNRRRFLSPTEEVERKQIQKLKLAKKDRLALLVGYAGRS